MFFYGFIGKYHIYREGATIALCGHKEPVDIDPERCETVTGKEMYSKSGDCRKCFKLAGIAVYTDPIRKLSWFEERVGKEIRSAYLHRDGTANPRGLVRVTSELSVFVAAFGGEELDGNTKVMPMRKAANG